MGFSADVHAWFPDGKVQRISPGDGIYYQACIHPEGSHVVFYGGASGPVRVWRSDLATFDCEPLTEPDTGAVHPVYSWDGQQIAFASDRGVRQRRTTVEEMTPLGPKVQGMVFNLFVMSADGAHVRQITRGPYRDHRPCFSPDGQTIVFVSDRAGPPRLWKVAMDGESEPAPLQKDAWGYRPWFSADGRSVYFFTDVEGRHQICRMSSHDGAWEPLANDDQGQSHGPFFEWSRQQLLMHSTRGAEKHSLWELPLDGGEPRMLRPPGFDEEMAHGTRGRNGVITFDVPKL
jgi:Tol biopolymer transport system component